MTTRRSFVAALALVALGAVGRADAQDPRASAAVAAARDWLTMTDSGDAEASHRRAGEKFRAAMSVSVWQGAIAQERTPRGAVQQRTLAQTAFVRQVPGAPEGDYAMLQFRTAFAHQTRAEETVTLEREADGAWRVVGYFIK